MVICNIHIRKGSQTLPALKPGADDLSALLMSSQSLCHFAVLVWTVEACLHVKSLQVPGELAFSCDILRPAQISIPTHLEPSSYIEPAGQPKLLVSLWKLNQLQLDTYSVTQL